jgi:hypothetical protein
MTINLNSPDAPTQRGGNGTANFKVIGELEVGANQAPGVYEGEYDVNVIYS